MAFCPNCGASADGKFCPKCGAAIAGPATGAAYTGANAGYVPPASTQPVTAAGIPSNIASALCYVVQVVLPIICLVVEPLKRDRKVRFDAFQSIFLTVAYVVLQILVGFVTDENWRTGYQLSRLLHLAEFILIVFLAIKAYQNQKVVLPFIGPLAEKQA